MEPILDVLICNGKLVEANLRRDRITRRAVESEMRLAGISSMRDVSWALIEPNGKISFIRRDDSPARQTDTTDAV